MWQKFKNFVQNKFSEDNVNCQICLRKISHKDLVSLCSCSHLYCNQCIHQYVDSKFKSYQLIKCMDEQCKDQINQSGQFYLKLQKEKQEKYQKIKRFSFVSKNPSYKLCPKQQCSGLVKINLLQSSSCNICHQKYCSKCLFKQHRGKCQKSSIFHLQNDLNFIQCLNCQFIIEKNQGCDHIKCRCGHQFCYKCGGLWKGASHTCIRSKSFQKIRSIYLYALDKFNPWIPTNIISKISMFLLAILFLNLIVAILVSAIQIFFTIFICLIGIVKMIIFKNEDFQRNQMQTDDKFYDGNWIKYGSIMYFTLIVIVSLVALYKRNLFKTKQERIKLQIFVALALVSYFLLPNILYTFYYEILVIQFIIDYSTQIIILSMIIFLIINSSKLMKNKFSSALRNIIKILR